MCNKGILYHKMCKMCILNMKNWQVCSLYKNVPDVHCVSKRPDVHSACKVCLMCFLYKINVPVMHSVGQCVRCAVCTIMCWLWIVYEKCAKCAFFRKYVSDVHSAWTICQKWAFYMKECVHRCAFCTKNVLMCISYEKCGICTSGAYFCEEYTFGTLFLCRMHSILKYAICALCTTKCGKCSSYT